MIYIFIMYSCCFIFYLFVNVLYLFIPSFCVLTLVVKLSWLFPLICVLLNCFSLLYFYFIVYLQLILYSIFKILQKKFVGENSHSRLFFTLLAFFYIIGYFAVWSRVRRFHYVSVSLFIFYTNILDWRFGSFA